MPELLHLLPGDALGRFDAYPWIRRVVAVVEDLGVALDLGWGDHIVRAQSTASSAISKAENIGGTCSPNLILGVLGTFRGDVQPR